MGSSLVARHWTSLSSNAQTLWIGYTFIDLRKAQPQTMTVESKCVQPGALFAPDKCILVHFTKARLKHNSSCSLIMPTSTINPSPCTCSGCDTRQETQLEASPATFQVEAQYPDQCPHQAHGLNMGYFPPGLEPALHCCCTPHHYHRLPCLVGPC
jgi:hypothetical protein